MSLFPTAEHCAKCGRELTDNRCGVCGTETAPAPDDVDYLAATGIASAAAHADELDASWRRAARNALLEHAARNHYVFVDDVEWPPMPDGGDARALGAVFREALRLGYIELDVVTLGGAEHGFICRRSAKSRGGPKPVWRSALNPPPPRGATT